MADPISGFGGRAVTPAKPDQLRDDPAQVQDTAKANTTSVVNLREDSVELSAEAQTELDRAGFDAAKVEQIKQALADGNYPMDARRIAEGFQEFEKLL
jgi:negative regulator of flagellin synthesis FlgM